MRLGFAGTPPFAVPALDALARTGHRLVAIFTQPDRPAGRGQTVHASAVKQRAVELGLEIHQPHTLRTPAAESTLRDLELDALVVVAYGLILPPAALAAPKLGCFNIHASLLPRWRGAAPIQRALLAGDDTTGISIMRMEAGLDTGPVLASRAEAIAPRDTAGSLHDRLAVLGGQLIVEALGALASGDVREQAQSPDGITYAQKIDKAEASIDWNVDAASVLRRVRAFNPWPIAETRWKGAQLRIWDAELVAEARGVRPDAGATASAALDTRGGAVCGTVLHASSDGVAVQCGRGALRILRMQLAGRKPLEAREFLKAQRLAGERFES